MNRNLHSIVFAILLLSSACASGGRLFDQADQVIASPVGFPSYPLESSDHRIWVEASLEIGRSETLGRNFSDQGVLPVAVTIGTLKKEKTRLHLDPDVINARLYLQDGTTLFWASPSVLQTRNLALRKAVQDHGLPFTLLQPWESADSGYLFFSTDGVRIEKNFALISRGDFYREVNIHNALLELYISTPDGPRVVRVGVRSSLTRGA